MTVMIRQTFKHNAKAFRYKSKTIEFNVDYSNLIYQKDWSIQFRIAVRHSMLIVKTPYIILYCKSHVCDTIKNR